MDDGIVFALNEKKKSKTNFSSLFSLLPDSFHIIAEQTREDWSCQYYVPLEESEKQKVEYELHRLVVKRDAKFTNFVEVHVTAAKTIYEDEEGFLIIISLPFVDLNSVKVSWRNTLTHGIIKVSCVSTSRLPFVKRHERTFNLTDPASEHCPPGEFVREIPLSTRIPEDANIEACLGGH